MAKVYSHVQHFVEFKVGECFQFYPNGKGTVCFEEMRKRGHEDTHVYANMKYDLDADTWEFEDEYTERALDNYWNGADYFMEKLSKHIPPSKAMSVLAKHE